MSAYGRTTQKEKNKRSPMDEQQKTAKRCVCPWANTSFYCHYDCTSTGRLRKILFTTTAIAPSPVTLQAVPKLSIAI